MRYIIAPLDLTTEEFEIYRLLYSKMDFDDFKVKYTVEQLSLDSNKKLKISKKSASLIIKKFIENDFIKVYKKGSKGNPTVYIVNKFNEIEKHKSDLKENQKEVKVNTKETNEASISNSLDDIQKHKINAKETQKEVKVNTKVNPINDKDKYKEYIDQIWKMYPEKKGKKTAYDKIPKILKEIGYDKLVQCINNYVEDINIQRSNGFKTLNYMNGSTFFNGRYIDYLEKPETPKVNVKEEKREAKYNPDSEIKFDSAKDAMEMVQQFLNKEN